jgi:hypothetical protein
VKLQFLSVISVLAVNVYNTYNERAAVVIIHNTIMLYPLSVFGVWCLAIQYATFSLIHSRSVGTKLNCNLLAFCHCSAKQNSHKPPICVDYKMIDTRWLRSVIHSGLWHFCFTNTFIRRICSRTAGRTEMVAALVTLRRREEARWNSRRRDWGNK